MVQGVAHPPSRACGFTRVGNGLSPGEPAPVASGSMCMEELEETICGRKTCAEAHAAAHATRAADRIRCWPVWGLRCRDRVQTGVETGVETTVNCVETVETAREGFFKFKSEFNGLYRLYVFYDSL